MLEKERMNIEREILSINEKIQEYAAMYEMDENTFLQNIDIVDSDLAIKIMPLLDKKISLLKQLWKLRLAEEGHDNLALFTRT